MMALGETVGVLYLRSAPRPSGAASGAASGAGEAARPAGADEAAPLLFSDEERRLAEAFADRGAMAIANLRLRETLRRQSISDPLTGVYNRRYMEEALAREVRRSQRRQAPL